MIKQDNQGKQFIASHDVRSAIVTASATLTTSDASVTTLVAGDADYFLDIFEVSFANSSTGGAGVDLGSDGTIVRHVDIPASNTIQLMFDAPLKQLTKNVPWTLDISGADITGTSIQVGASLVKKDNK